MEHGVDRAADESFVTVDLPGLDVDDRLKMHFEVLLLDDRMQQGLCILVHDTDFALSDGVCLKALQCNDFFIEHRFLKECCIGLLLQFDQYSIFLRFEAGLRLSAPATPCPKQGCWIKKEGERGMIDQSIRSDE